MSRLIGRWRLLYVIALVALSALSSTVLAQPPPSPSGLDAESLCVVNGTSITRAEVNKAVQQRWGRKILEDMIERKLILQAAQARGLSISAEELNARLAAVKAEYSSLDDFNEMMRKQGIKGPAFRQQLRCEMLLEKLVKQIGAVADQQARAYYDEHISTYQSPEQRHMHAIVATDAEQAYQAREQVAGGADFDEIAAQAGSDIGGDWGWMVKDDLRNPLIRETAFSLKSGHVSNPIFVDGQYYVLWVEEIRPGVDRSFEEVKDDIVAELRAQRGITQDSIVAGLWRTADISVPWKAYYYLEEEYEQLDQIKVTVDGKRVNMATAPMILASGHMLVMAKPVLQAMGAKMTWDAEQQAMTAVTDAGTVQVTVGSLEARSGDRVILMKEAPQIRAGSLFVSPREVVGVLGADLEWDPVSYTLKVRTAAEGAEQQHRSQ